MLIATRWLWAGRSSAARLTRLALVPVSLLYRGIAAGRARAYGARLLPARTPALPTVAVGNLTVGGSGKTPIAAWIAGYYAGRGLRPAIVLRGYGGDEGAVHRRLVRDVIVVENPNRFDGARTAQAQGADVVVLDDAYQRLDVGRDLNIAVVSAESGRAVRWTLPAGPWREGWNALKRADLVIVTRKRASREAAQAMAARVLETASTGLAIARLGVTGFRRLLSHDVVGPEALAGTRVLAAAGIADPDTFAFQCRRLGAKVALHRWRDHQAMSGPEIRRLLRYGRGVDYVVVTEKDAVKLRGQWPAGEPEPLVASLEVQWERGQESVETALDAVTCGVDELLSHS